MRVVLGTSPTRCDEAEFPLHSESEREFALKFSRVNEEVERVQC